MCGIVGAILSTEGNCVPILIEGLSRLEYRGYDSCGLATINEGQLRRVRSTQRVAQLAQEVAQQQLIGSIGIAHTRWATHGSPTPMNAHPHVSRGAGYQIALVHNGIIENYEALRADLVNQGYVFESQTDTEVVAHLIHSLYAGDIIAAVQAACQRVQGAYALGVVCDQEPDCLVGARKGSPLVLAIGEQGYFLASDALAIAGQAEQLLYMQDGDIAVLRKNGYFISDVHGAVRHRDVQPMPQAVGEAELGPYRHYMQKEIFEQPRAVADTVQDIEAISASLFGPEAESVFADVDRVLVLACGTSFYAGLTAKYWIEELAALPTAVEIASEYRYRHSVPDPRTLVVVVSQSGETADTLAALQHAQSLGMHRTLAICNVASSAMVRNCQLAFITRAGVEIGVASTKAFTTQLTALFLLALVLAQLRGRLDKTAIAEHVQRLRHLPAALKAVLALEPQIMAWAQRFASKEHALFLGRGMHYPIALEGALKLKEISYIHAEGYPAGELKHGPLALVTEAMPVVTIAPNDELLEKLKANIEEVRTRGGELYVFADADTQISPTEQVHVIQMPKHYAQLSPILYAIPLQLLAYHTALARQTDVDKPRNLAKSVTVE